MENNKEPFQYTNKWQKIIHFLIGSVALLVANALIGYFAYMFILLMNINFESSIPNPNDVISDDILFFLIFAAVVISYIIELVLFSRAKRSYIVMGLFTQLLPLAFAGMCFYAASQW